MFDEKFVFIITDRDRFFYLYCEALIEHLNLTGSDFVAIVIKTPGGSIERLKKVSGVTYVRHDSIDLALLNTAKNITSMSLSYLNSVFIDSLLKQCPELVDLYCIFITDDEFERWLNCFNEFGVLKESSKYKVTSSDINVLRVVKHMIGFKNVFGESVRNILGRDGIQWIDCGVVFDTLQSNRMSLFSVLAMNMGELNSENYTVSPRVLFRSKEYGLKGFLSWLRFLISSLKYDIHLVTFISRPSFIIFSELLRLCARVFFNAKVKVDYKMQTNSLSYTMGLLSCSHFILQDRGGASSARTFIKYACGSVIVKRNSHNDVFFHKGYGCDLTRYDDISEVIHLIKNDALKNKSNQERINMAEINSLARLSEFYRR